ncbi:MAG: phosphonate metabolism protein/1,5-bisphosphokinase (PRPP-forming) PhnN [Allorhizobium sp.]
MTGAEEHAFLDEKTTEIGTLVVVVGPSGVGKDSLIDFARRHFDGRDDIRFARRSITRPSDAVGEDHHPVTPVAFEELSSSGAFSVSWHAHGLGYGISTDVLDDLAEGRTVVVNGSRSALASFRGAFPKLLVVNVTARADVLAKRLATRGRETEE